MPQDMQAVINFRLADGDTVESVMEHCRAAVQDPTVELRYQQANDPSAIARRDGYGYGGYGYGGYDKTRSQSSGSNK